MDDAFLTQVLGFPLSKLCVTVRWTSIVSDLIASGVRRSAALPQICALCSRCVMGWVQRDELHFLLQVIKRLSWTLSEWQGGMARVESGWS